MTEPPPRDQPACRRRLEVRGQVQGVGFRPFVFRIASELGLSGFVANDTNGAVIEVQGPLSALVRFEERLRLELPPLARITALEGREAPAAGDLGFRISESRTEASRRPDVTPDAATCPDCLRELFEPADRRYGYAFTNCTNCGPRYSIIRDVPYDRLKTTMAAFTMCPLCEAEYRDPANRRFHAQPNACPNCGPALRLITQAEPDAQARVKPRAPDAMASAPDLIRSVANLLATGAIVALKGIGGYHLACRADDESAVRRLRAKKLRDGKPLAIMAPNLAAAEGLCHVDSAAAAALTSPAAPIVLMKRRADAAVATAVAPGCGDLGLMLPYAPLHHLLFAACVGPLVMTSANLSGQPLTYRDADALRELADVADAFVVHDREIERPIDDSVVFPFEDALIPIRRARGYAPATLHLESLSGLRSQDSTLPRPLPEREGGQIPRVLAVGGELKCTVCLLNGPDAVLSEHLGDVTRVETYRHFVDAVGRLRQLFSFEPTVVACDLHPRYLTSEYARKLGLPLIEVQHHHAHIASVLAEHNRLEPVIGLSCDGVGYGPDGAIWGCEVLRCERGACERLGHLDYFPLVGGDAAAIETWRPAAALLASESQAARDLEDLRYEQLFGSVGEAARRTFRQQMRAGLNAPPTSSLGRVFDAVAFILGLCAANRHEAEAAMALEAAADGIVGARPYAYRVDDVAGMLILSIRPALHELALGRLNEEPVAVAAARFHETVAQMLFDAARRTAQRTGIMSVALSGGCFANRRLLARLVEMLRQDCIEVLFNRAVPAGDGGIALGQAWVAAWRSIAAPSQRC